APAWTVAAQASPFSGYSPPAHAQLRKFHWEPQLGTFCCPGDGRWYPKGAPAPQNRPDHLRESDAAMLRPKYITFDCYGTLTNFRISQMAKESFPDRVAPDRMDAFVRDFAAYRLDEVMGDWKPYQDILRRALERTCRRWKIEYRDEEAR